MYRSEWVNAVIKRRLQKRFALRKEDVEDEEDFHCLLREELNKISSDLQDSRLFYANIDELLKASNLQQWDYKSKYIATLQEFKLATLQEFKLATLHAL